MTTPQKEALQTLTSLRAKLRELPGVVPFDLEDTLDEIRNYIVDNGPKG